MIHGEVYSDIFKQIIILAASEFEILAKALCKEKGERAKDIKDINKTPQKETGAVKKRSESHSRTSQPLVFAGFGRI